MEINKNKKIGEYKAVIFDMDGTLYFHNKMTMMMAMRLAAYYLLHVRKIKDLLLIKKFREVREKWDELVPESHRGAYKQDRLDEEQYQYVGSIEHVPAIYVKEVVEEWMYKQPLSLLPRCRDEAIVDFINVIREKNIKIIVYSDYPVTDKLAALNISADQVYSALDEDIMSLKPDPKGLLLILKQNGYQASEAIMIGDRMSKDGQAAMNAGIDYIILEKGVTAREKMYAVLMDEFEIN